jgi:hypothetical protein
MSHRWGRFNEGWGNSGRAELRALYFVARCRRQTNRISSVVLQS